MLDVPRLLDVPPSLPLNRELIVGWVVLQAAGALLAAIVRYRDRARPAGEKRAGSLWRKYASYFAINLSMLLIGAAPERTVLYLIAVVGFFMLLEMRGSIYRQPPKVIRRVTTKGLTFLIVGLNGLAFVKHLDPSGNAWGWLWLVVATTDAYSQLFGQGWGRAKMAPRLSPGKTWVGFYLGTASAVLVGVLLRGSIGLSAWWAALPVALLVSLAATAGDLIESWMKRSLGIKDFAHWMGDHGGLLDRFDSLLGAAPVCAVLCAVIRLF